MTSRLYHPFGYPLRVLLIAMVMCVGLGPSAATGALQSTHGPRLPEEMKSDIPAMALYHYDVGISGMLGVRADLMGTAQYASFLSESNGRDPETLATELDDAGFNAHVAVWSGVPSSVTPDSYDIGNISMIAEYDDADGAEIGYNLAVSWITGTEEINAPRIGDQSTLMRQEQVDPTYGVPSVQLDYAFQVENYVGILTMAWYGEAVENEYGPDEMAELAEVMVDRMDEGGDEAGSLAFHVLRLDSSENAAFDWYEEMYDARGGEYSSMAYDEAKEMDSVFAFWEESGIEDSYRSSSVFLLPDGTYGAYVTRAYDLGRPRAARAWIDDSARYVVDSDAPGGYAYSGELEEIEGFDTDVVVMTYSWNDEADGFRAWFQVDGVVYSLQADGPNGIDEDAFHELVEEQIACAEDDDYCEPMEVPDDLFR